MQQHFESNGCELSRRQWLERSWRSVLITSFAGTLPLADQAYCFAQNGGDGPTGGDDAAQGRFPSKVISVVNFLSEDGKESSVEGRVLVRGNNGGVLVEDASRRLWMITSAQFRDETKTERAFKFFDAAQLGSHMIEECRAAGIDADFHIHTTKNYVIAAATPEVYSDWTGQLLERMQIAFRSYWKNRRFELTELVAPLPVLILSGQAQFAKMAEFDRTPASAKGQGYFLVTSNRIVLFDLTAGAATSPATTIAEVQRRAQRIPASVATVVHEATHQIAFNRGMHRRYADNPVWLTEGMAMYFEAPDLKSRRGWSGIGKVNKARLFRFREFLKTRRKSNSIETLVRDNSRFADPDSAIDAYSEAWALTYFLIRTRLREYSSFLKSVSQKQRLRWDSPEERLAAFNSVFESDLSKLDREFLSFTSRLR